VATGNRVVRLAVAVAVLVGLAIITTSATELVERD